MLEGISFDMGGLKDGKVKRLPYITKKKGEGKVDID